MAPFDAKRIGPDGGLELLHRKLVSDGQDIEDFFADASAHQDEGCCPLGRATTLTPLPGFLVADPG